ncbi:hypothetical protein METP2_03024 [Methanosarcinales archaeon]|nr:PHP domain-containing protein [Candidatus Methanoperedens sp. BLZ2]KAB2944665.1 MAG: PHP domain-containing protein [Candidatus Methanoperedens sp.]MBZ0175909.1 PHP domain-containing protein [Candidatus Methanoperedens nitroreducens]CAG0997507.1 hypothetical protein METP2_03024 [Methanosarcinales archaeon]MCX9076421.1 PHP domain-containing protein [Candidatus Methanoperedens sp.]MCX9088029.1 PHP domain-containing protein [Candidatus Methanoperedens sp.]
MEEINQDKQQGIADIHTHTRCSGFGKYSFLHFPESVTDPVKAVEAARRKKLDVLCITDHNTIQGAIIAKKHAENIDVVIGEEISSADGEILALFIQEKIKPMLDAPLTIDLIHDRGGVAVAAHPFSPQCHSLGKKICHLKLDGVEVFNAYHRDAYSNLMAQTFTPEKLAIDKTTKKTKALALIGAGLYIGLPLSYFFGISGEIILNIKGKRKWNISRGQ